MTSSGEHRGVPAFSVSFSYENRYLAQKVVGDLVSRFIDESIRNRSTATYATTQFLKDQMEQAKKELDDIEVKLQAFQTANNGRLPDQMDANMRQLQTLQTQVQYLQSQISRGEQDKLQMESGVQILKDSRASVAKEQPMEQQTAAFQRQNEKLNDAERDVKNVQTQLDLLLQRYSESYPDVQTVRGRLKVAKQIRDELLKEDAATKKADQTASADKPAPVKVTNPAQVRELRDIDNRIRLTQSAIEAKDMEIAGYKKQMGQASEAIKSYSGRVETVPASFREYGDLMREKEIAREKYVNLDENLQKAQIAQDMEGRKQGESLELLDPASLPHESDRAETADDYFDGRGHRPAAGNCDCRRAGNEGHLAQESERRPGVHADGDSGQHSAARERFCGAAPQASGLAGLDHRVAWPRRSSCPARSCITT